jgi:hypothetical protein
MKNEHITRHEVRNKLEKDIAAIKQQRKEIEAALMQTDVLNPEFDKLTERDKQLSVHEFTAKFKLHQLTNNQPLLGDALPEQTTSDRELQGRGGARTN